MVVSLYIHVYEKFMGFACRTAQVRVTLYPIATRLETAVAITSGEAKINKINKFSKVLIKNNISYWRVK